MESFLSSSSSPTSYPFLPIAVQFYIIDAIAEVNKKNYAYIETDHNLKVSYSTLILSRGGTQVATPSQKQNSGPKSSKKRNYRRKKN